METEKMEKLLTRAETMEFLGIKSTTLWKWHKTGKLKAYKIASKQYFKYSEVMDALRPQN